MESESLLKISQVARIFKVSPRTVRGWIKDGKLKAEKTPGKQWRIPYSEITKKFGEGRRFQ